MSLSLIVLAIVILASLVILILAILELNRETEILGIEMISDLENIKQSIKRI